MVFPRIDTKDGVKFVVALKIPTGGFQFAGKTWGFHTAKVV